MNAKILAIAKQRRKLNCVMSNANKNTKRPPKKTEMLEVRVAPEEKAAFLEVCRQVGRSASEVIRDAMRAYANFGPMARLPRSEVVLTSAFLGALVGAWGLLSSASEESPEARVYGTAEFTRMDLNRDQLVERQEFIASSPSFQQSFMRDDTSINSSQHALFVGLAALLDVDARLLIQHPQEISHQCWQSLEAYLLAFQNARYDQLDLDDDGLLTRVEFSQALLEGWMFTFEQRDRNGDNVLNALDREQPVIRNTSGETRTTSQTRIESKGVPLPQDAFSQPPNCAQEQAFASTLPSLSHQAFVELTSPSELIYQCSDCNWETRGWAEDLNGDGEVSFEEYASFQEGR